MVISIATPYEARPIHTMHMQNVNIVNLEFFLQSGTVNHNKSIIGHFEMYAKQLVSWGTLYGVSAKSRQKSIKTNHRIMYLESSDLTFVYFKYRI